MSFVLLSVLRVACTRGGQATTVVVANGYGPLISAIDGRAVGCDVKMS